MASRFDYNQAFSRNIGWVTEREQLLLRSKRVAIAGLGGVGGSHLLTLTRLGIGAFNVADLDRFEVVNFNRQAGASMRTLGADKSTTLAAMARDINPELDLRVFDQGIGPENTDEFLQGADLYLDGLDFFAVDARRHVFAACARLGIPAVTAAPLGFSTALLCFLPGKMTFEQYFQLEGQPLDEQLLRFFVGLAPGGLHRHALVDPSTIDLAGHRGPSTAVGCELCAGAAATQVAKILLNRGDVPAAPAGLQFDAYSGKLARTWRPGGNGHPLQQLALKLARKKFLGRPTRPQTAPADAPQTSLDRILDLARWAPSGDNTQPWRFEVIDDNHLRIHGSDTRDWCVYDLEGRASQIAIGALMENIAIAASGEGLHAGFAIDADAPETAPVIDVTLTAGTQDQPVATDPLAAFIRHRVTQRRPLTTRALQARHRACLEAAVGPGYRVVWLEREHERQAMARLLYRNAGIRLTIPEAYEVHRRIIEWDATHSTDRIPDRAIGLDKVNLGAMRWAMHSWDRVKFLNRYFAGTVLPRVMLDWIPGRRCAAHFFLVADKPPRDLEDHLAGGRAMQRLWLTATSLGLQYQPEMTPLIFSNYVRDGRRFTDTDEALTTARALRDDLIALVGLDVLDATVFMGRIGYGPAPEARSVRLRTDQLRWQP